MGKSSLILTASKIKRSEQVCKTAYLLPIKVYQKKLKKTLQADPEWNCPDRAHTDHALRPNDVQPSKKSLPKTTNGNFKCIIKTFSSKAVGISIWIYGYSLPTPVAGYTENQDQDRQIGVQI